MAVQLNPELKVGDEVILLYMTDEPSMKTYVTGTVKGINNTPWGPQYTVKWDNGRELDLIPETDKWAFKDDIMPRKKVNEEMDPKNKNISKNFNFMKYVKNKKDVFNFLKELQKSGLVNMLGARPFLTYTSDNLETYIKGQFKDVDDYEDLIRAADISRNALIRGVINWAEASNSDMDNINRLFEKLTKEVMELYVGNYSSFIKN